MKVHHFASRDFIRVWTKQTAAWPGTRRFAGASTAALTMREYMKSFLDFMSTVIGCALIIVIGVPFMIILAALCVVFLPFILLVYAITGIWVTQTLKVYAKEIQRRIDLKKAEAERDSTTVS